MQRLALYDSDQLNLQPLADLAVPGRLEVLAHTEPLTAQTADPNATMAAVFVTSRITDEVFQAMPKLKLLIALSATVGHIDMKAAHKQGVRVISAPERDERSAAEYVFALLLALARRLPQAQVRPEQEGIPGAEFMGIELAGKTLGLIGTGPIGRHLAAIAGGFDMEVVAWDSMRRSDPDHVEFVSLEELLERSHALAVQTPLTPKTEGLLNAKTLARARPGTLLINTSHEELIDHDALIQALTTGRLAGAALDTFEQPDIPSLRHLPQEEREAAAVPEEVRARLERYEALLAMPNVIITSRNLYDTVEARDRLIKAAEAAIHDHMNALAS